MIEIRDVIVLHEYGKGYEYANPTDYVTTSKLYDKDKKRWEIFEDVNGNKFWAREVKK